VLWYLSGLTCTHANVTEKGEYRAACAEHGMIFVAPDTSPRGEGVPDDPEALGLRAGRGLLRRRDRGAVGGQLPHVELCRRRAAGAGRRPFPDRPERQGITGHSMGGHGALTLALKHPGRFRSVSAFAPIVAPGQVPWGQKALAAISATTRGVARA
jgi:S-formylglutathione hydrolase